MIHPPSILIIEDEDLMRGILAGLVSDAGYTALTASTAHAGLECFMTEGPALTISDINLGGMDGIELLGRIKQVDPDALVVMMTAYSSVETAINV